MKVSINIELDNDNVPATLIKLLQSLSGVTNLSSPTQEIDETNTVEDTMLEEESEEDYSEEDTVEFDGRCGDNHWRVRVNNAVEAYLNGNMETYNSIVNVGSKRSNATVRKHVEQKLNLIEAQNVQQEIEFVEDTVELLTFDWDNAKHMFHLVNLDYNDFCKSYDMSRGVYYYQKEKYLDLIKETKKEVFKEVISKPLQYQKDNNLTKKVITDLLRASRLYYYSKYVYKYPGIEDVIFTDAKVVAETYNISQGHVYKMRNAFV